MLSQSEMLVGYNLDEKYKYLCFYHKAFPFMRDAWGLDFSDSKEELLDQEYRLFSSQDISEYFDCSQEFRLVLNAIATDPQSVISSDGEYVLYNRAYAFYRKNQSWDNFHRGWVCLPSKFTRNRWKNLSSYYRRALSQGHRLHSRDLLYYTDRQLEVAQQLIREVFADEIDTHEIKD